MSIFGSISGFFSAIGRTGSDSHESGSLSESLSESSSIQSVAETQTSGSRRTSAVSLVGPTGPAILDTPEVDLSHLSEEERAQIAAVIARAKTLQTLDDLTGGEPMRRPSGIDHPITQRPIDPDREFVTGNEKSASVTAICRLPDDREASSSTSCSGCGQPTCLSCCCCCFEDGGKVQNKKCTRCSKTSHSAPESNALHDTGSESSPVTQAKEAEAEIGETSAFDKTALPNADLTTGPTGKAVTCSRGDYPATARCPPTPKDVEIQGSPTDIDDSEIGSPTQRGAASHRPKDLLLSNLSSLSSSTDSLADTTSWSSDGAGCRPPEPKSTSEPQLAGAAGDRPPEEATVPRPEPRCRSRSFDGSDRKRPTVAKDRGTGHATTGYHDCDRNQSPSRRSPKSPPRSPSWMRMRESPTRTSCHRTRSPQVSPSEKYPSKLLDEPHHTGLPCSDEYRDYEAYLDERRNPTTGLETTEGKLGSTEDDEDGHSSLHLGNHFFSSSGYEEARESIDLASFAATVASGTAHLTSMSFSPPRPEESVGAVTGAMPNVDGIPDDHLCLPLSSEGKPEEPIFSASDSIAEDHSTGETDYRRDAADSPEDLLFLTSSLTVGGHWSRRLDLSPIPDVSPSAESEELDRTRSHVVLRRTHSNEDQGAGSYSAKCIAETSPTFGSFKRCPSYHNILALPELEKPEPVAKFPDQTVAIREERNAQVTGGVDTAVLPKLPEEQELSTEDDVVEVEKREQTEERPRCLSFLEDKLRDTDGNGVMTMDTELNRSQGLFVIGIDGTRRKNGSFGNDGKETSASYGSFLVDDKQRSSMGNVLTAEVDEQVFLSDEELREIDLDEELPPKYLLVRKPKKCPPSVTSAIRQPLSTESPTEDINFGLDVDEPSGPPDRKRPDGCSDKEDSRKDGSEPPVKPSSRRKLPSVPGDCETRWSGHIGGMDGETRESGDIVSRARTKGYSHEEEEERGIQEAKSERSGQVSGLLSGLGKPRYQDEPSKDIVSSATDTVPEDLVSRESPDTVRLSPMTKQRSKSNDEKTTTSEGNRSALKPRSVSADDRQIHHRSSRHGISAPDDLHVAPVKDEPRPQTVPGSSGVEEGVTRGVNRSVVIRNTAYRENDSSQPRHRNLDMQASSSAMRSGADDSAESGRTGRDVSSVRRPVNQNESNSTVSAGKTDVTKTTSLAAPLSAKNSGTVERNSPEHLGVKTRPKVPPKPSRPKTDASGLTLVATISLKKQGLEVPVSVHGLQLRVKDEIKIVTATRRLRLDEAEEIRILEAEFAERSKERKLKAGLRTCRLTSRDRGSWSDDEHQRAVDESGKARCCGKMEEMLNYEDPESRKTVRSVSLALPSAAAPAPKQSKRPTSDPMFAKFSPIDEDGDAETVFLSKTLPDSVGRQYASLDRQNMTPPIRLGTTVLTAHKMLSENPQQAFLSRSAMVLHSGLLPESCSLGSLSASSLSFADQRELSMILADNDDAKGKEERLHYLQTEIEKRRKHLSEMAQRGVGGAVLSLNVLDSFSAKSDPRGRKHREDSPDLISSRHAVSSGLIKPIDYQINPENYYVRSTTAPRQARVDARTAIILQTGGELPLAVDSSVYSSFEYLTHKTESAHKSLMLPEKVEYLFPADVTVYQGGGDYGPPPSFAAPIEKDIIRYSESEDSLLYCPANYGSSRDSGVSSNMTGPDVYAFRSDHENTPPQEDFRNACCYPTVVASSAASVIEYYQQREAAATPAMPLLGDVTSRSRSLLRDIGSRPLSDDLEKYFQVEEPLSLMCRDDSDYSVTDSTDDYIMEGGVTIRLNSERKPQRSVTTPRKYPYPTKRILLTSDPKDRSSRGFGVQIVGGQYLPWCGDQLCAYVSYIFPGSVADQIHGELQEGDQVLELNGETLTGKTNEEVNQILANCNCEVELVVRHGLNLRTFRSITMSTINTDSNRSSYDNMPTASSFEESIDGLDRDSTRLTSSNQRGHAPSSQQQQQQYLGSDYIPQGGSVPIQRSCSSTAEFKRKVEAREDSPADETEKYIGEIQLQLSYDDYDGTLNVHIIQARNLRPKYKTGYSDPFVKVYLLPYRSSSECKRRTRCVARTLNPEWHRTVVFLNIPQRDLAMKTIDFSVWDHDRFMPNQFLGELLIDLSDDSYLDNRPHWYRLSEDSDNRYGKRPRTGTMSSSDSAQSSSSSRSRRPDREGPASGGGGGGNLGLIGRREDPRGPDHRPTLSDSPSPYRYQGVTTSRTLSDSEESIAKRSCRYEDLAASSSRELGAVGQSGGGGGGAGGGGQQYKSDQQLTAVASVGRQDPVEQRLTYTDESWTDCSDRGHGLAFSRGQVLGCDRGQGLACERGQGLACDSRSRSGENAFENRSKMAATLHCILTAIFCCLRSSASGSL